MKEKYFVTKVCGISLVSDCILAAAKLIIGRAAHSQALISDGVHSCADSLTSLMTLLGTLPRKSSKKKERAEKLTLIFICTVLILTGATMFFSAILSFVKNDGCSDVSLYALSVSLFALFVKEGLFRFLSYASKKCGCPVLYAQAWHHRSDALSSVASFIGVVGSALGFSFIDSVASAAISVLIIKTAVDILRSNKKSSER